MIIDHLKELESFKVLAMFWAVTSLFFQKSTSWLASKGYLNFDLAMMLAGMTDYIKVKEQKTDSYFQFFKRKFMMTLITFYPIHVISELVGYTLFKTLGQENCTEENLIEHILLVQFWNNAKTCKIPAFMVSQEILGFVFFSIILYMILRGKKLILMIIVGIMITYLIQTDTLLVIKSLDHIEGFNFIIRALVNRSFGMISGYILLVENKKHYFFDIFATLLVIISQFTAFSQKFYGNDFFHMLIFHGIILTLMKGRLFSTGITIFHRFGEYVLPIRMTAFLSITMFKHLNLTRYHYYPFFLGVVISIAWITLKFVQNPIKLKLEKDLLGK